jgi:hypothetical protein
MDRVSWEATRAHKLARQNNTLLQPQSFQLQTTTLYQHLTIIRTMSKMAPVLTNPADGALRKKTFPWEKLPFETRDHIFKEVDKFSDRGFHYFWWNGVMVPLIIALRSLPISYQHALQWFAKERFYFSPKYPSPERPMLDLAKAELAVINAASVDLRYVTATNSSPEFAHAR